MTAHACPDCRCYDRNEPIPPPSTSSPGIRRMAIETVATAIRAGKERGGR